MDLNTENTELWGISDRTSFALNCLKRNLKFQSTTPTPSVNSPTSSKGSAYHGSRLRAKARGIYQRKRRLHAAAKHKCCLWIQFFIFTIWHAKHLVQAVPSAYTCDGLYIHIIRIVVLCIHNIYRYVDVDVN